MRPNARVDPTALGQIRSHRATNTNTYVRAFASYLRDAASRAPLRTDLQVTKRAVPEDRGASSVGTAKDHIIKDTISYDPQLMSMTYHTQRIEGSRETEQKSDIYSMFIYNFGGTTAVP